MAKAPSSSDHQGKRGSAGEFEADPKRGDEILKRMLQSKPKPHKEMVKGQKEKDVAKKPRDR